MPAYFDTGFSVREPMWHGLGTVLDDYPEDWPAARKAAGLEWEPIERPLYVESISCTGCGVAVGGEHGDSCTTEAATYAVDPSSCIGDVQPTECDPMNTSYVALDSHKAICRSDTGKVLGVPTGSYSIIGHDTMGEIVEALLDVDTSVKFETAGSVREGAQVWALAYIDEPIVVPGDDSETYPFLALLNSHDGSAACKVVQTSVRVVCWNTFQMASAEGDRTGRQFTFRHSGDVQARIDDAKQALAGVRDDAKRYAEFAASLASVNVDDAIVSMYLHDFIVDPSENGEQVSDRVKENVAKARATWLGLYNDSPTTASIRGNAYGVLQASTEYLDHVRSFRSRDTYMNRTLLRPEPFKAHAVSTLARVCPDVASLVGSPN
jgi:phage/plasmid-like protein (TIGR03299 family)